MSIQQNCNTIMRHSLAQVCLDAAVCGTWAEERFGPSQLILAAAGLVTGAAGTNANDVSVVPLRQ